MDKVSVISRLPAGQHFKTRCGCVGRFLGYIPSSAYQQVITIERCPRWRPRRIGEHLGQHRHVCRVYFDSKHEYVIHSELVEPIDNLALALEQKFGG